MKPGLSRLLPLPLGLLGGVVGGVVWWFTLLLHPDFWNDLDELDAYVILGTIFAGWGLFTGCLYAFVPPFRSVDPARDGASYRLRRTIWLFGMPALFLWGSVIGMAVFINQSNRLEDEMVLLFIFPLTVGGAAWVTQECCDWLRPRLPREVGVVATATAILFLSLSLGTIVILCVPYFWVSLVMGQDTTAMRAAADVLQSDLEGYSVMLLAPAVQGSLLAVMVPACEAVWKIPPPRRRDLGTRPYLLLAFPVLAVFDLAAVLQYTL